MEYFFLVHAVKRIVSVTEGGFNSHIDKVYGPVEGFRETVSIEHTASDHAGEGIARAGIRGRDIITQHSPSSLIQSVVSERGHVLRVASGGGGDNHVFRAEFAQLFAPLYRGFHGDFLPRV